MDRVVLTRGVLKALAAQNKDYVVLNVHTEEQLVFVEPLKYEGQGKGVWVNAAGRVRDEGKKL